MPSQGELFRKHADHYRDLLKTPEVRDSPVFRFAYQRGIGSAETVVFCLGNQISGVCFWSSVAFTHGREVLSQFGYDREKTREFFITRKVAEPLAFASGESLDSVVGVKKVTLPEFRKRLEASRGAWLGVADADDEVTGYAHIFAVINVGNGRFVVWNSEHDEAYFQQTENDPTLSMRSTEEIYSLLQRMVVRTRKPRYNLWFFRG